MHVIDEKILYSNYCNNGKLDYILNKIQITFPIIILVKNLLDISTQIRDKKQIVFVTHNPLLVVNLDVDNVIFVKNINGNISINNGCLEYEDEQTDILDLIAKNMDGGKETIEKRLKVYGNTVGVFCAEFSRLLAVIVMDKFGKV